MNDNLDKTLVRYRQGLSGRRSPAVPGFTSKWISAGVPNVSAYPDIGETYRNIHAIVPLKQPADGMKVRVDGRTFVGHVQFESGVVVPGYVARDSGLPRNVFYAQ